MSSRLDILLHPVHGGAIKDIGLYAVIGIGFYLTYRALLHRSSDGRRISAMRTLRGPQSDSFLNGCLDFITEPNDMNRLEAWIRDFGKAFVFPSFFTREIYLTDLKAIAFIFNHPLLFRKPVLVTRAIQRFVGTGLFTAEGEAHKKQRKVLSPAFSIAQIRQLTPAMVLKTQDLKEHWHHLFAAEEGNGGVLELNVLDWLERTSLDIIGETAFGYHFNALQDSTNELALALSQLFSVFSALDPVVLLTDFIPVLQYLPTKNNAILTTGRTTMQRVGRELVAQKKADLAELARQGEDKDQLLGKDILSVLIKSNMNETAAGRLDDETVIAQICTFILAGLDTTSSSAAWALYALAKAPDVQAKLRAELLALPNDTPTMDELHSLPYLDNVVKETLRLHTVVPNTYRSPLEDVVILLAEPVIDKDGRECREIFLRAGDNLTLGNYFVMISEELWGPDAHEFKPERHDNPPEAVSDIPSVFGNVMTFSSGSRSCIAWRLAVVEFKAILFTLIRNFDFDVDPALVVQMSTL